MKKVLLFLLTLLPLLVSGQVKRTIHVATAGTLPTLISEEEKYEIEELTLSGELNGTDFKFIRDMAGVIAIQRIDYSSGEKDCWAEYIPTEGLLKSLNLAESRIISGGEVYYYEGDKKPTGSALTEKYYTESDAISSYLFARTKLETIILPNSITSLGECVFYNCNRLTSITIPNSVTSIDDYAFSGCSGLTSIVSKISNPFEISDDVFPSNIYSTATLTVPSGTKSVYEATEGWKNFKNIVEAPSFKRTIHVATAGTLPTLISEEEKYQIEELTLSGEINGDDLRLIRNMAGRGDYYQDDGEHESTSGKLAYLDLSEVIIKAGGCYYTHYLGDEKVPYHFYLKIDNEIPTYVFNDCKNLISIIIPNSVTSIGSFAFSGTTWFKNQPDGVVYAGKVAYCYKGEMPVNTSIVLKDDTKGIAEGAFVSPGLSSITIPNSVEYIGSEAFWGCSGLSSIKVESDNQQYDSRNNCNAIIDSNNKLVVGCKNTIIPNSVTSIGGYAFFGCTGLTSISIPEDVTTIGSDAFGGCAGLIYVTLPRQLISIKSDAFGGCISLTDVYCKAEIVPSADNSSFSNSSNIMLHVPSASLNAYKSTEPWNQFKKYATLSDSESQGKCAKPTISTLDGKAVFNCETPSVSFHWSISTSSGSSGVWNNSISLPITLNVFATKDGYENSDVATYEFFGINGDVNNDGEVNVADHVKLSEIIMDQK